MEDGSGSGMYMCECARSKIGNQSEIDFPSVPVSKAGH